MGVLPRSLFRTTAACQMIKNLNHVCHRKFSSVSIASTRFPHLNSPTSKDADELLARMEYREGSVITNYHHDNSNKNGNANIDDDLIMQYNHDWINKFHGHSSIVVRPQTTAEVSSILAYCHEHKIGVVPQAGNTGLVGGSVPIADEIILSIQKLNNGFFHLALFLRIV